MISLVCWAITSSAAVSGNPLFLSTDSSRSDSSCSSTTRPTTWKSSWEGVKVFDWEMAYFDRGPLTTDTIKSGGSMSAYYYDGYLYSNEYARGFDVLKIDDRRTAPARWVHMRELDVQTRPDYFDRPNGSHSGTVPVAKNRDRSLSPLPPEAPASGGTPSSQSSR